MGIRIILKNMVKKILYKGPFLYPLFNLMGIKMRKLNYLGMYNYCKEHGEIIDLIKEQGTHRTRAAFCKKRGLNELGCFENGPDFKIYIARIKKIKVFADSEFIYTNKNILTDRFCYDTFNRYLCPPLIFAGDKNALYCARNGSEHIEKGIFLLKLWSIGWWHLTCEVIPRIILIDRYEEFKNYPILLDEKLFEDQRNIDLINIVNKNQHPIIKIQRGKEYSVDELVYPSHVSWLLWNQEQANSGQSWVLETDLLLEVRNMVLDSLALEQKFSDKIFITRGNNKRFDNEIEVSEYFAKNGFQVVNPDKLTFKEEVEMCFFAKAIVCTAGSAVTNLLYANKNVRHVMIGLKECQTEANAPIIDAVGIENYRFYCANTVKQGCYLAQSIGHIALSDMADIIQFCSECE